MAVHAVERLEDVPEPTPDADFVVIDVVTASTSIVTLVERGARYVRPFGDAQAAREFGERTEDCLLVGEDGGEPLAGFDYVPLPLQLRAVPLEGRPVAIRTTNGTRAVEKIGDGEIFIGSTVNAAAVAETIASRDRDTWLVGAGYGGAAAPEDAAGVELIKAHMEGGPTEAIKTRVREQIQTSPPAVWLRDLGLEDEIDAILEFDSSETVPRLRDGVFVPE